MILYDTVHSIFLTLHDCDCELWMILCAVTMAYDSNSWQCRQKNVRLCVRDQRRTVAKTKQLCKPEAWGHHCLSIDPVTRHSDSGLQKLGQIFYTPHPLSQMPSELKSCAGRQDVGGWCIGMQELACVPACAPGGGRQPGQPGQTRSRQTCWSQAQPPRLACRDQPAQENWAFCPGLFR